MFLRILFAVLILTSIVFSQTLTKTKSTTSFFLKNLSTDDPIKSFFYVDAAAKTCSLSLKTDSINEFEFSSTTPILWQGIRTLHLSDYDKGTLTPGAVVEYEGGWTINGRYAYFYIKNNTANNLTFNYTHPTRGLQSITVNKNWLQEVKCATNNSSVTCVELNLTISNVTCGDRLLVENSSRFLKSGSYISFWIKNITASSATFTFTNANGGSQTVTVAADSTVECPYVSLTSTVSCGSATYSGTIQKGDLITYSPGSAIEVSPNIKGLSFENINVEIFNLKGQRVAKGIRLSSIKGLKLTSGLYIARMELASSIHSKRILITK